MKKTFLIAVFAATSALSLSAQAASVCPGVSAHIFVGGSLFDSGSYRPNPTEVESAVSAFHKAKKMYKGDNYFWIQIDGHTDSVGSDASNDGLSTLRYVAIKRALIAAGAKESQIVAQGHGEKNPRYDNSTAEGRHMNRAVRLSIHTMDKGAANWCYANHPDSVPKK